MIPLHYLALRVVRRRLPEPVVRALLRRRLIIKPGLETLAPRLGAERFCAALAAAGRELAGSRVLIFGYGGRFAVAVELLRRGARHVVLLDPYAETDPAADAQLAREDGQFLHVENGRVVADPERITVVHAPVEEYLAQGGAPADLVLSNSVFEHVADPEAATAALARLTPPEGYQLHFVDLRDHFFRYPFEMLCYSEAVWRRYLNPTSHLNRLRARDYERIFRHHFADVRCEVVETDAEAFRRARPRIRPEFLTDDERTDAITRIVLHAQHPRA